ncbi:MAG: transporter [Burkholderiales bacterium]|nr:transporter [Burkholderiales bacterium]
MQSKNKSTHQTKTWLCVLMILPLYAKAAHPLVTEDAGLQGLNGQQMELNADQWRAETKTSRISSLTYTYGLSERTDIFATLPRNWLNPSGMGDVSLGQKSLLTENANVSWAWKSEIFFPTGSTQKGLTTSSHDLALTLIRTSRNTNTILHSNLALVLREFDTDLDKLDRRQTIWRASSAGLYALNQEWQVVADVAISQAEMRADKTLPVQFVLGMIYSPNSKLDLDWGIRQWRHQRAIDTYLGMGMAKRF